MEWKNVLRACVPPSITNLASLVPFDFSSDASNTADIPEHIKTMQQDKPIAILGQETAVLLVSFKKRHAIFKTA